MSLSYGLPSIRAGLVKFYSSDGLLVSTMYFSQLYLHLQSEYLIKFILPKFCLGEFFYNIIIFNTFFSFVFRNPKIYESFQSARLFNVKVFW
jgi:hypothetical protein